MTFFCTDISASEITSVCALVVSVASLWATRRHQRLSVTPHLADYTNKLTTNEGLTLTYEISNNGIGPARIRSFVLFRDGKAFPKKKEGDYVETFVHEQLGKKLNYQITHSFNFGEDDSLKAGDTRRMVQIFFSGAKQEDREKILSLFDGIGIRIEYESFYGQRLVFDRKSETKFNYLYQSDPNKVMSREKEKTTEAEEKLAQQALEKYKELYNYSTDILLNELERFNRADEKAAKLSAAFVFLLGIIAYFDKWVFDKLQWSDFPTGLPADLPLIMAGLVGLFALLFSATGLFFTIHAIKLRPIKCRPLNQDMLDFFEKNSLLNIYYGLARENSNALEAHRLETEKKHKIIVKAFSLIQLTLIALVELFIMFCLYSWT